MQYVGKNIIVEYKIMINQKGEEITYAEVFRKQSKPTYAEELKKNAKKINAATFFFVNPDALY